MLVACDRNETPVPNQSSFWANPALQFQWETFSEGIKYMGQGKIRSFCQHILEIVQHRTHLRQVSPTRSITVNNNVIQPATVVRDLGVWIDSELSMHNHVSRVAQTCFFHLHRLWSVRRQLGRDVSAKLVSALVLSRLDYCNAVLAGLPASTLASLQRVLHAAARLVLDLKPRDHVISALRELHWLPVAQRIECKLSTGTQGPHQSYTRLHHRFAHTHSQHSNTLVTVRLQQWRSSSTANRAANRGPCIFHGCTSCMKSATHRTETDAVINNNFSAPSEDVIILYCLPTMECAIGLTVGGALEMQLLLYCYCRIS